MTNNNIEQEVLEIKLLLERIITAIENLEDRIIVLEAESDEQ